MLDTRKNPCDIENIQSALEKLDYLKRLMVKLSDIAEKLNLSLTTVSRALNDYSDVSQKTRELVKMAAKELGYIPNRLSRNLALKRSHLVSLLYYFKGSQGYCLHQWSQFCCGQPRSPGWI